MEDFVKVPFRLAETTMSDLHFKVRVYMVNDTLINNNCHISLQVSRISRSV